MIRQHEQAIQDFDKAIAINPNFGVVYVCRGDAYSSLKQYEKALKDFDKAIELDPDDLMAKKKREACLKALGK